MKPIIFTAALLVLNPLAALFAAESAKSAKPNIIIIVGDDCGYNEFSFNGGKIPTPRIDEIAQGGVKLSQGYVSAAVCAPSRAGLFTGRYQQRFGFLGNLPFKKLEVEGIPLDETMLQVALKPAGYKSIAVGKWHLGWAEKFRPIERGFDSFYGILHGGRTYFPMEKPPYQTALMLDDKIAGPEKFTYLTDELGERAAGYVDQYKADPFFLYLAFTATHNPREATPEDLKAAGDGKNKEIAAMTIALDRAVGKVLDALDRNGLTENTLVVFLSDNGGVERHDNKPLRGYKRNMYEGGIRVPFAMRWPRVLPAGTSYDKPIISLDLFATSLAVAGIEKTPGKPLDGVNLIPYLTGKDPGLPHKELFFTYGESWAVQDGNMKLVMDRDRKGPPELFDLAKDVSQKKDLSGSMPEVTTRLKSQFDTWNKQNKPSLWGNAKGNPKDE